MAAAHKYAICQVLNIPYEVIDPDKYTPQWSAGINGGVTLSQLNSLKAEWKEKYKGDLEGLDKAGLKSTFALFVKKVLGEEAELGGTLDASDFRKWTIEEYSACVEALK
jgi:hypothetical protein